MSFFFFFPLAALKYEKIEVNLLMTMSLADIETACWWAKFPATSALLLKTSFFYLVSMFYELWFYLSHLNMYFQVVVT